MDVEAVPEDGHLEEEVLVVGGVEGARGVQVLVVAVCMRGGVLSQRSKSWQVTHWNRMPQIGSLPQWLQLTYSCRTFSSTSFTSSKNPHRSRLATHPSHRS